MSEVFDKLVQHLFGSLELLWSQSGEKLGFRSFFFDEKLLDDFGLTGGDFLRFLLVENSARV